MPAMPDKGISAIAYNFLNLPNQINQNANTLKYFYRADGTKLKKQFTLVNSSGTKVINTEYMDGFQYSTPNTEPIRKALENDDDATMKVTTAGEKEAFSRDPDRQLVEAVVVDPGTPQSDQMTLSFFPTAEGFYDFENLRYIYQYKDHLGNVRVSYTKNGNDLEIRDRNDYYPFGMSFLKPSGTTSMYDPMAIPYNYKYNGKELQETGMYDYGARFYMPDIGRWGVVDPLAEKSRRWSTYTYVADNPMKFIDPDGRFQIDPKEFNKTADAKNKMALNEFAHTKTGYNLLAQFAKAGDIVGGVKFTKDGALHKAGVDLKLNTNVTVMSATGTTDSKVENGRLVNNVSIGNGRDFIGNSIETIGHELSVHALPKSLDFADDKKLNLSSGYFAKPTNFLQSLGYTAQNNDDYYGIFEHYQEKVTRNARNTYISPILNQYYNSINKNVQQKDINNAIDDFSLVSGDTRIKY